MAQAPVSAAHSIVGVEDATSDVPSVVRHLRAESNAPPTITTYSKAILQFRDYLATVGIPTLVASVTREHVES